MEKNEIEEKRRVVRLRRNLQMHFQLIPAGSYGDLLTQDISEYGARIISDTFIPRTSQMQLHLYLEPHRIVDLAGKVAWSQRIPNSYRYQVGLEFTDTEPESKREIAQFVAVHK